MKFEFQYNDHTKSYSDILLSLVIFYAAIIEPVSVHLLDADTELLTDWQGPHIFFVRLKDKEDMT